MMLTCLRLCLLALALTIASPAIAKRPHTSAPDGRGFDGTTILIIRHAEKPAKKKRGGPGLAAAGDARAQAYADYFRHFRAGGATLKIDTLVAAADTRHSDRSRETLEALSRAIDQPIQQPFADDEVKGLARWLAEGMPNRGVLIAWHQGKIPKLLKQLGADPATLLPDGKWPLETFNWVIMLRYDAGGRFLTATRIVEPDDISSMR